jgi:uncharacterized iron-regulated membrane protein
MVAMSIAGAAPIFLVLTGLWVWLRKRPGERVAAERKRQRAHAPVHAAARAGMPADVQATSRPTSHAASRATSRAITPDG